MASEKYVTDFEMSEKLKNAGYPQEGAIFYWVNKQASFQNKEEIKILVSGEFIGTLITESDLINCWVAAPTLGEILDKIEDFSLYKCSKKEEAILGHKYSIVNGSLLAFGIHSSNDILVIAASTWLLKYGKKDEK